MIARLFITVAHAACRFLRSADQILSASLYGVMAATKAAEVGCLQVGQQEIFSLKRSSGVGDGVKQRGGVSNKGDASHVCWRSTVETGHQD